MPHKPAPSSRAVRPLSLRQGVLLGALGACVLSGPPVFAEEVSEGVTTVTVQGQRPGDNPYTDPKAPYRAVRSGSKLLTQDLMETPKSVVVLPEALIEDMGLSTFRDLFRTQPGITLGTGEGGNAFGDRVFIRGFDARNDIYVDGVRDPGLGSREVFAVQQIEILKGPSSSFGGRGTTGGSISMITKKPREVNVTSVEASLGTEDTQRLTVDTNHVFSPDLAVRLNLMGNTGGIAGRDHVYSNRLGAAAAVRYKMTQNLTLEADIYHLDTDYMPDWGIGYDTRINAPAVVPRGTFYGLKNRDFGKTKTDVATVEAKYDLASNLSLNLILRSGDTLNQYRATAPERADFTTNTLSANAKPRNQKTRYITQQTYLNWSPTFAGVRHEIVLGYELSQEDTRMIAANFIECGTPPCSGAATSIKQDITHPDYYMDWIVTDVTPTGHTQIVTNTEAAFIFDTIEFNPKWSALAGIRADRYRTLRTSLTYATGLAGIPVASQSDFISFQGGLVYRPAETVRTYLSLSTSANPPCEQLDSTGTDYGGCDGTTFAIDPIKNFSTELGIKATFAEHFDVTAAVFAIDRSGVPSVIRSGSVSTLYTEKQAVSGIELTASGAVTPKLSLFAGLTALNTKTEESTNPGSANVGRAFPNVSEDSATLTVRYAYSEKLALGASLIAQSEKFGGTYAAGSTQLPGFTRVDLMAEYEIRPKLDLRLNVQNVFDTLYYDALYRSSSPYVYVAPGRSMMLTLDWHF